MDVPPIVTRLRDVYGHLTPGAIERADLDGIAFTVTEAADLISELAENLRKIHAISSKPTYPGNNLRDIDAIARQALAKATQ